jgi:hypothetical protein
MFHYQDDSIQLIEGREENSGIPQVRFAVATLQGGIASGLRSALTMHALTAGHHA